MYIYFYVYECFAYMYASEPRVAGVQESQKKMSDPPGHVWVLDIHLQWMI